MANPLPLVGLPGDDLAFVASFSMSDEDPDYPATNLSNGDPSIVAKSTANSTIINITTPSVVIKAVALINTNAETSIFDPFSGPNSPIVIPSLDYDGQRVHGWLDLRENLPLASTGWSVTLTRTAGPVWIGHIALLVDIHELNLKYGLTVGRRRPGDVQIQTRLGSQLRYGAQIRTRWARGVVDLEDDEALMRNLEASAKGIVLPFVFIPDEAENDAWLVINAANDWSLTYPNYGVREVPLAFEELSGGPPNG